MALELTTIGNTRSIGVLSILAQRTILPKDNWEYLVLDPPFQRGAIWSTEQQQHWIESCLDSYPLPAIFLNTFPSDSKSVYRNQEVVIDGQQRIRATQCFLEGKLRVRGELFTDQDIGFQRSFRFGVTCPVVYTGYDTDVECAELYLKLLTAGTAHTREDLDKAKDFIRASKRGAKK